MAEPLSPSASSTFKQNFDLVTPEFEEDPKLLWGVPVPPFVSDKVVSWVEENFPSPSPPQPIEFRGFNVLKKVTTTNFQVMLMPI